MKTDQLIHALTADISTRTPRLRRSFALAALAGLAISAIVFFSLLELRSFPEALSSPRFILKPVEMLLLTGASAMLAIRLAQPGSDARWPALVAVLALAIIIAALAVELLVVPRSGWMVRLAGVHWYACVVSIVLLALPILAASLLALRLGAPMRPAWAGAAAGLFAGALSASLYVMHCPDDSPIFVAAWFSLAVACVAAIGAVAGGRLLRW